MINLGKIYKNFGLLEVLVSFSLIYVISMLIWTASTREAVESKANEIKYNHKQVVTFMNDQVNNCDQNKEGFTNGVRLVIQPEIKKLVDYLLMNIDFKKILIQLKENW